MAKSRKRNVTKSRIITAGTTINFEEPKSPRTKEPVAKVVVQEINPVEGFVGFLRDHAIVGLSIGFIIGNQMASFVKVLVSSLLEPATQLLFGTKLSDAESIVHFHGRVSTLMWGQVVYNILIIILLIILIYVAVRIFNLDKLDKPKDSKK